MSPEEIAEMLFRALMNADEAMMAAMARAAVTSLQAWNQAARWGTYYLLPNASRTRKKRKSVQIVT